MNYIKKLTTNLAQIYMLYIGSTSVLILFGPIFEKFNYLDRIRALKALISQQNLKYQLQKDVDNKYSRPSYIIERRAAQFISIFLACFVWSTLYPLFILVWVVIATFIYHFECYSVAKSVFLKKNEDIYLNELVISIS